MNNNSWRVMECIIMHYFSAVKEKCKKIHFYFWSTAMGRYAALPARRFFLFSWRFSLQARAFPWAAAAQAPVDSRVRRNAAAHGAVRGYEQGMTVNAGAPGPASPAACCLLPAACERRTATRPIQAGRPAAGYACAGSRNIPAGSGGWSSTSSPPSNRRPRGWPGCA